MASTGAQVFGSMMEVLHTGAIQWFGQAAGCDHAVDGVGME
jgi:hypothetical protein